jgi:cobalt-zinc-cadmium efflux system protein
LIFEKKSKKPPDNTYTYGYAGYSIIGSLITTTILLFSSLGVIYNAILRIISPVEINYNSMIVFAICGFGINLGAAIVTKDGKSINQKAINLHMLEDVLGWAIVLVGAIIMNFTDFYIIDPLMSIGVSIFIFLNSIKSLKNVLDILLKKVPCNINIEDLQKHIIKIDGVVDVHHIHIWSIDGYNNCATMHIVTKNHYHCIKEEIRNELRKHGICHVTIEFETEDEECCNKLCYNTIPHIDHHHSHHHNH